MLPARARRDQTITLGIQPKHIPEPYGHIRNLADSNTESVGNYSTFGVVVELRVGNHINRLAARVVVNCR